MARPAAARTQEQRTPVVSVQLSEAVDHEQQEAASYTGLTVNARRTFVTPRASVGLSGGSRVRRYPSGGGVVTDAQLLETRVRFTLSPRTSVTASQRVSWIPTLNAPPASTAGVIAGLTTSSAAGVSRLWSRRTVVTVNYRFDRVSFAGERRIATDQGVSASISRTTRRNLTWHLALDQSRGLTTSAISTSGLRTHAPSVQVSYSRASAPNTTLTLRLTPALTHLRQVANTGDTTQRAALVLAGMARLDHRMTNAWRLGLSSERSMSSLDGYDQPIVSEAVGGYSDVRVGRLATASASVVASRGTPGIYQTDGKARALSGSARVALQTSATSSIIVDYARSIFEVNGVLATGPQRRSYDRTTIRIAATLDMTPWHPSGWFRERR